LKHNEHTAQQGSTIFPPMQKPPQNCRYQKSIMKQVPKFMTQKHSAPPHTI